MKYIPKSILVVGGSLYTSIKLIEYLLNNYKTCLVVNIDFYDDKISNYHLLDNKNYIYIKGSILNYELVEHTVKHYNIDTVFHLGLLFENINTHDFNYTWCNTLPTHILLEICNKNFVKRFIYLSNIHIYNYHISQHDYSFHDIYLSSIFNNEVLIKHYEKKYEFPNIILRIGNVYGSGNYDIINRFIENNESDNEINKQKYINDHYIHIDTLLKLLELIMINSDLYEVYNYNQDTEYYNKDIYEFIKNYKLNKEKTELKTIKTNKLSSNFIEIGYIPKTSLQENIIKIIDDS